ncbi:unnamed protein product, partial [Timema podura]|nr:unnamed protein product [Timema podura]
MSMLANQLVFVFQIPLPRDMKQLDYSRWQQNLIGILQLDIAYYSDIEMEERIIITLDSKLGYRNKGDPDDDWKITKRTILPSMSRARRLHYEGVIYRFKFLMLTTLLCAAMTVIGFILGQASEGRWKWDDEMKLEFTSAFFTGVYGMWNIYIFALIVLYAPSHKQWPTETENHGIVNEEIEFSRLATDP